MHTKVFRSKCAIACISYYEIQQQEQKDDLMDKGWIISVHEREIKQVQQMLMIESRVRYMGIHCKILSTFVYAWKFKKKSELSKITQLVMIQPGF